MKVTAKSNIKYGDVWYHAGDVLDVEQKDIASFGNLIVVEKPEKPINEPKDEPKTKLMPKAKDKE